MKPAPRKTQPIHQQPTAQGKQAHAPGNSKEAASQNLFPNPSEAIVGATRYSSGKDGSLHCQRTDAAPTLQWSIQLCPDETPISLVAENVLLHAGYRGKVVRISPENGDILQTRALQWDLNGEVRLALSPPYLYAGCYGNVFFLDAETLAATGIGKIALQGKLAVVNLLFARGHLYAGTHGTLYGWTADGHKALGTFTLGCDGNCEVQLTTDGDFLYVRYDGRTAAFALDALESNPGWALARRE